MKILKNIAFFFLVLVALDGLLFRFLVWKLPNESAWNSGHFFNALYEFHNLPEKKRKRIVIVGSSIAYYSINANVLARELKLETGEDFDVVYFAFAGMTPFDAWMLSARIDAMDPDLIVYPVNFIDFRLHRPYVMGTTNESVTMDQMLLGDSLFLEEAPQSKYFYPDEAFRKYFFQLGLGRSAQYLSSWFFAFYRYRDILPAHFQNLYNHRFTRNTSYHGYTGIQIEERVNHRGWTGRNFTFIVSDHISKNGIWIEIVPEMTNRAPVKVSFYHGSKKEEYLFKNPGWKLISSALFIPGKTVKAALSDTWEPFESSGFRFDYLHDKLGVRLQQTFGFDNPANDKYYQREERIEDLRFLGMSNEGYKQYFYEYLLKDAGKRPGIAYLNALRIAKQRVAGEHFKKGFQYAGLEKFVMAMVAKQRKVMIINHPENPLSLAWYGSSGYYHDYLGFLQALTNEYTGFIDWKNNLQMQEFNDYHHVTYNASLKLTSDLAKAIKKSL